MSEKTKVIVVTEQYLQQFKAELLSEIKELLKAENPKNTLNQMLEIETWLKSSDVKRQLRISTGTLQNMRKNGTIPYFKVGGSLRYKQDDIDTLLR